MSNYLINGSVQSCPVFVSFVSLTVGFSATLGVFYLSGKLHSENSAQKS